MKLIIVTPKRKVLETEATEVIVPGTLGSMGFLEGHTPLVSTLGIGVVEYHREQKAERLVVIGGFVEVKDDVVTILADAVELPSEIDVAAARAQLAEAEKRAAAATEDTYEAMRDLELARARQELSGEKH